MVHLNNVEILLLKTLIMTFISHAKRKIISFTCCNYCKSLSCDWL